MMREPGMPVGIGHEVREWLAFVVNDAGKGGREVMAFMIDLGGNFTLAEACWYRVEQSKGRPGQME